MIICSIFVKLAMMRYMGTVEIRKKNQDASSMKKEIQFLGADSPPKIFRENAAWGPALGLQKMHIPFACSV